MTSIKVLIKKSNISNYTPSTEYTLILSDCIGYGSYGILFKIKDSNFIIKILLDNNEYDEEITDMTEIQVVNKIINDKNIKINCDKYATVSLKSRENQFPVDGPLNIFINNVDSPVNISSVVFYNRKQIKFDLFDNFHSIIMPYFTPLNQMILDTSFIRNELFLCKIINLLVESTKELINLDLINFDIKIANAVVDSDFNLRFIDFGIVKKIDKINNNFVNKTKYYIWPLKIRKISQYLPYMIGIFIMEFYYQNIHRIKYNSRLIEIILNTFDTVETISFDIKKLLRKMLVDGQEWNIFVMEFENIKSRYDLDSVKLPLFPSAVL